MKELPDIATIGDELCGFLRSAILDENVELDRTSRLSVLGVDSVSLVELVLFIERRFNVTLPEPGMRRDAGMLHLKVHAGGSALMRDTDDS